MHAMTRFIPEWLGLAMHAMPKLMCSGPWPGYLLRAQGWMLSRPFQLFTYASPYTLSSP